MICLLNPVRNASKLADAQTELAFLNNADISEPSTTTDICKGSRNGIAVEVFGVFRTEIVSPVSLYLSRGAVVGACPEPDRAAGKLRTAGTAPAPPYEERIVSYIGKV